MKGGVYKRRHSGLCTERKLVSLKRETTQRLTVSFFQELQAVTSGFLSAMSMARPGPKPVRALKLVELGRGRRH